ncbi:uncharacterized protein NECHADRAFT_74776 [Fusarium vanettenii 77-13-4]|uniref:DUF8004 domain-containing protein n=1 Tax=Fusarium vanettenii (strain ATCC MYA-4622 / CBS 123669 / FGSC 9596 / NRRL 45880 / 77-13-4) TaxID=660122 RepID=C7YGX7_FUSV7|nr:uncharacterized protein NECHADRAFT_74776 [Fusarium vanettenii 77-13-4]EEU47820.1 hypothetical protein NECHADRAFT_74776 [Fusarium vanettenii 77-13-4]
MPSMTSSKSFRASIIPASFSMLRSNTDPESSTPSSSASSTAGTSTSTSHDPRKKTWHKSNTVDLSQLRDNSSNPGSAPNSDKQDAVRHDKESTSNAQAHTRSPERPKTLTKRSSGGNSNKSATLPKSQSTTNLPPAKQSNRKSRFRLSSLLPLITLPSESSPASPKKMPAKQAPPPPPVPAPTTAPPAPPTTAPAAAPPQPEAQPPPVPVPTHSVPAAVATATAPAPVAAPSPAPTKSSSPTNTSTTTNTVTTAATAPTTLDYSPSSSTPSIVEPKAHMPEDHRPGLAITTQDLNLTGFGGSPPSEVSIPTRGSDSLEMPQPSPNPQIMAPIPPSPEMQRAVLTPQEPMVPPPPPPTAPVEHSGKLRKENPDARRRSGSLQHIANGGEPPVQGLKTRTTSPGPDRGRRSSSVQSPTVRNSNSKSRVVSTPLSIRPSSSKGDVSQSPTRGRLRRSWLPGGGRSRSNSVEVSNANESSAWVLSDDTRAEYNVSLLKNGEKVPELWNESGAVLVYLYPKDSGHGPAFKVQEFTISSSYIFNELIQTEREAPAGRSRARSFGGRDSLTAEDAARYLSPPNSPPIPDDGSDDLRLYLPTAPSSSGQLAAPVPGAQPDLDRLIGIRNLFAFLTGQPLVATKTRPTNFHAFLQIAALLEEFGFVSFDGATFGDAVDLSFGFYMDQHALADCRHSREKTLEALILGERMRSSDLYNEAFAHAAGKYAAIMELRLPLFEQVSPKTRVSLERAHLDLLNRQHNANQHLENFDFPAIFSGIANSTSMAELRHVRFKVWKNSFSKMRHFVMSYYKHTFGNWPPKASSKKNPFAESGLNRLVLKVLYSDMCALYDLIVDRTNRTSRVMDEVPALSEETDKMIMSALRNIMSEFDRSKPPVLPPVPYDCPQLPVATSILETYDTLPPKKQAKFDKNIKEHELILILNKAYNYDTNSIKVPFLDKFKEFELREARGKTPLDFADQRIGYWLFLYTVIQSLPVLVVDAPGMQFTEGVEYFLCEPPMGNPPWIGDQQVKKMWYEVAGGGGLVELSTDAVLFSVEATYHRSHCWLAAAQWDENGGSALPVQATEPPLSPLEPPRSMFLDGDDFVPTPPPSFGGLNTPPSPMGSPQAALRPRTHSPSGSRANQAWRSSIALGLEPVPLQPPSPFGERSSSLGGRPASVMLGSRSQSVGNLTALGNAHGSQQESPPPEPSGATFDDILGNEGKKPKKKKGFF